MSIAVTKELYQEIENDLEQYYNKELSHWGRIHKDGKRMGYQAVIDRFDLICDIIDNELVVKLKNKRTFDIVWSGRYDYV